MNGFRLKDIVYMLCAFAAGYAMTEVASGFRYTIAFDWQAVLGGLLASGLYHGGNVLGNGAPKP